MASLKTKFKAIAGGLCLSFAVAAATPQQAEAKRGYNPPSSHIVIKADTGEVLLKNKPDALRHPASLTKIMTAIMVFDALEAEKLTSDQKITISKRAASMEPSKIGLKPGSTIAVEDALKIIAVKSANDIAVALAEAVGGTEEKFAEMMTERAKELGMKNTMFANASGLPAKKQRTTARDMALLSQCLIRDYATYYDYFSLESVTYKGKTYRTHNRLMTTYPGMDGIKTGFIRASGFNLAASTIQKGERLIAVIFGGKSSKVRNRDMKKLLDSSFQILEQQRKTAQKKSAQSQQTL